MGEALITRRSGGSKSLFIPHNEAPNITFSKGNNYYLHCGFRPKYISVSSSASLSLGGYISNFYLSFDLKECFMQFNYNSDYGIGYIYSEDCEILNEGNDICIKMVASDYYGGYSFNIYQRGSGVEFEANEVMNNGTVDKGFVFNVPCIVAVG